MGLPSGGYRQERLVKSSMGVNEGTVLAMLVDRIEGLVGGAFGRGKCLPMAKLAIETSFWKGCRPLL